MNETRQPLTILSACGQVHTIALYDHGCTYAHHLELARSAAANQDPANTSHHLTAAAHSLWPLHDLADPNDLLDFIAGTFHFHEFHLRQLGVPVQS
jgi:hypothetical protein